MYFRYLPLSLAANYNYYFGDQYKEQLLAREGLAGEKDFNIKSSPDSSSAAATATQTN